MSLFRCNIDRTMVDTGPEGKPFLWARKETKQLYCGRLKYCTKITEKKMDDIGAERPYFVKVFESVTVRLFGIGIRNREQSWKFQ